MDKLNGTSLDLIQTNVELIKKMFPNVVTDGKIDFDMLRNLLGDNIETSSEKYQFSWSGKFNTIKFSQTPSTNTLLPIENEGVDEKTTKNFYIQGDNVEVLKLLQKTYFGKVNVIYIDPPYNTGKDFVYNDDFKNTIENYKTITSQQSRANPDTNGRYHTDWLNMMYSRLLLARNLLAEDGMIFISIDDHEIDNLRKIGDEIFGPSNLLANMVWTNNEGGGGSDSKHFKTKHEYVLCYAKNVDVCITRPVEIEDYDRYRLSDEYESTRGKYQLVKLASASIQYSKSLDYPIEMPDGSLVSPVDNSDKDRACWRWSKAKLEWGLANGFVVYKKDKTNTWQVYTKQYVNCDKDGNICPRTKVPLALIEKFSSTQASNALIEMMGGKYFSYPKPVDLVKWLINRHPSNNALVMDFFSGSGTTAQAVFELNSEDGGQRNFILVQLPELVEENSAGYLKGFRTLCDIGQYRVKLASSQIKETLLQNIQEAGLLSENCIRPENLDLGFKVFKLESTNIRPWDGNIKIDEQTLFDFTDTIKEDRTNLDVAYEIMLKYGIFNMPLKEVQINNKTMYNIGDGYMIICLDNEINTDDITEIAKQKPHCVVFKEKGFEDDNVKINATYTLERLGVEDVKCI